MKSILEPTRLEDIEFSNDDIARYFRLLKEARRNIADAI